MWKLRVDPNCLWCQVIASKYLGSSPSPESAWWRDIQGACSVDNSNWFEAGSSKLVWMGNNIMFWHEEWAGAGSFRSKYCRLYNLSKHKWATVNDCGKWVNGVWLWAFSWRRPLAGREEQWAAALLGDLSNIQLVEGCPDHWTWLPSGDGGYTVNSAYLYLQGPNLLEIMNFLLCGGHWHLLKYWIIYLGEGYLMILFKHLAVFVIVIWNLLFECSFAFNMWQLVSCWLGVNLAPTTTPRDHLFGFKLGWNAKQRRVALSIWLYSILEHRDEVLYL